MRKSGKSWKIRKNLDSFWMLSEKIKHLPTVLIAKSEAEIKIPNLHCSSIIPFDFLLTMSYYFIIL